MFSNVKYMNPIFWATYCGIWNSPTIGREVDSCLKNPPLLFGKIHWLISMFSLIWWPFAFANITSLATYPKPSPDVFQPMPTGYRHLTSESTASGRKASRSLKNLRASDASHRSPVHIGQLVTDVRSREGEYLSSCPTVAFDSSWQLHSKSVWASTTAHIEWKDDLLFCVTNFAKVWSLDCRSPDDFLVQKSEKTWENKG